MRKLMSIMAMVVLLVPLFAAVALGQGQATRCHTRPCYGTGNADRIYERVDNRLDDRIIAKGGSDLVLANKYTNDTDQILGGANPDKINVADGDTLDKASGGLGKNDWCIVDARKEAGQGCERVWIH